MAKLQTFLDFEQEPEKIITPKVEIWKDIKGFENKYQVSNLGRIRSLTRQVKLKSKIKIWQGQILKNRINYGKRKKSIHRRIDFIETRLGGGKSDNRFKVARLVAKAFLYIPWDNFKVSFKDKDKTNVCADNLIVKENILKKYSEKFIGRVYGKLTVIDNDKDTKSWTLKCLCGNIVSFNTNTLNKNPPAYCCFDCKYNTNINKLSFTERLLIIYKNGAKKRGYSFELSLDQFCSLIKQNCFYCDSKPNNKTKFSTNGILKYNGIDRFNNDIGYVFSNCVTCCKHCNYAKSNTNIKSFIDWIYKISYRKDKIKKFYEGLNTALLHS